MINIPDSALTRVQQYNHAVSRFHGLLDDGNEHSKEELICAAKDALLHATLVSYDITTASDRERNHPYDQPPHPDLERVQCVAIDRSGRIRASFVVNQNTKEGRAQTAISARQSLLLGYTFLTTCNEFTGQLPDRQI